MWLKEPIKPWKYDGARKSEDEIMMQKCVLILVIEIRTKLLCFWTNTRLHHIQNTFEHMKIFHFLLDPYCFTSKCGEHQQNIYSTLLSIWCHVTFQTNGNLIIQNKYRNQKWIESWIETCKTQGMFSQNVMVATNEEISSKT